MLVALIFSDFKKHKHSVFVNVCLSLSDSYGKCHPCLPGNLEGRDNKSDFNEGSLVVNYSLERKLCLLKYIKD